MTTFAANVAAAALYLGASFFLLNALLRKQSANKHWLLCFAGTALAFHGIGINGLIFTSEGFQLGFFRIGSVLMWVINLLVLTSSVKKPLQNLFVFLFPLSSIAVTLPLFVPSTGTAIEADIGIGSHILLSVLAYSLLTIAAFQALLLAFQNHQLKHKHPTGLVRALPPLQTMESLLFEILWAGEILLTLSILSGVVFVDDMFAQHLVHKTILTIIAWVVYGVLLWGRHRLGWRGNTAIRWALGGFCALMLAYFGSKLVLELILPGA